MKYFFLIKKKAKVFLKNNLERNMFERNSLQKGTEKQEGNVLLTLQGLGTTPLVTSLIADTLQAPSIKHLSLSTRFSHLPDPSNCLFSWLKLPLPGLSSGDSDLKVCNSPLPWCMSMHVVGVMSVCTRVEVRGPQQVSFLNCALTLFFHTGSLGEPESHWLGWLANELQKSTCLIATNPYEAEVTGTQNIPGIWWAFRNSNIVLVWQALSWLNRLSKPPVALLPFSSGEKTLGKQGEHLGDCPQVQVSLFPSVDHTWYCLPPWVWLPASCSPDCLTGQSVLTYLSDKASEGDKECSICYLTVITHNPCLPASVTRISSELP